MERATGFEPVTYSLEGYRSSQLSYARIFQFSLSRADGRTRTDDLLITNQLLYQLSYASTAGHNLVHH